MTLGLIQDTYKKRRKIDESRDSKIFSIFHQTRNAKCQLEKDSLVLCGQLVARAEATCNLGQGQQQYNEKHYKQSLKAKSNLTVFSLDIP